MDEVAVIADPEAAVAALEPIRGRLLAELAAPASAAALGARLGLARQKITYHLGVLEGHGLVGEAGTRQWGGLKERLLVASAGSYLVSPEALGPVAADPARISPQLSASYLIALAGRVVREMGQLLRLARARDKRLATLAIDTELRFRSPAERAAFAQELTRTVTLLAARYHDAAAPDGRTYRLIVLAHPAPHAVPEEE